LESWFVSAPHKIGCECSPNRRKNFLEGFGGGQKNASIDYSHFYNRKWQISVVKIALVDDYGECRTRRGALCKAEK
jgi:hypothetical protein